MAETRTRAIFEQILEDHEALRSMIADLRAFLEDKRPEIGQRGFHTWAADLSHRLVSLHDKIFRHFRAEDQEGLMDDLAMRHPSAAARIENLNKEHDDILLNLRNLMSATLRYSEGKSPRDPRLRKRMLSLLDQLNEHERTETDLILNVEYNDLGEGG